MSVLRGYEFPDSLWYEPELMIWLAPDGESGLHIGLSALALATAGEFLVFAARPLGARVEAGRAIGNVETAKTVNSVRTPIGGCIAEINEKVEANGEWIGRDPYQSWLVRLVPEWPPDGDPGVASNTRSRKEAGNASDDASADESASVWRNASGIEARLRAAGLLRGSAAMQAIEAQLALYRVGE